jgi:tRNA (guanine-N7-)-methyltransferase
MIAKNKKKVMSRRKLNKFGQLQSYPNAVSYLDENAKKMIGKFISGKEEIILELGCGRGEYTLALAKKFPQQKFIGIDIKGDRLWYGAKQALVGKLNNVLFLRMYIDHLLDFFPNNSINQIWLTFSDPFPKKGDAKKRLSSSKFLKIYQQILKKDGIIYLKTDADSLYGYSLESLDEFGANILGRSVDLYAEDPNAVDEILTTIQTHYEKKHLKNGKKIKYIKWKL